MTSQRKAAIVLFLEGLASAGLQMIALRQSVPFVGSSILSTSIVISVFLAALALGYYKGGQHKTEGYQRKLITNILASLVLFGIGLSYPFVSGFYMLLSDMSFGMPVLNNPLVHLFIFCGLIIAPLVFGLAQTVPLLLNTASMETSKSEATGNATALSTIGNVLGCLLTSLVLMYYFGTGVSIFFNCLMLAACLIFLLNWRTSGGLIASSMALSCLVITYFINVKVSAKIFEATTPYSNIQVADTDDGKRLVINRSNASFISHDGTRGWEYIELIKKALLSDAAIHDKHILVLGSGGFTLSTGNTSSASFHYVDIDPELKSVSEEAFLKRPIESTFTAEDARGFLLTRDETWDYIVIDLYSNASTIPAHTSTIEFFSLVNDRLKAGGKAIMNIVANPTLNDRYSASIDRTIRTAMSRCITDITNYEDALVNILYFCTKAAKQEEQKSLVLAGLYTDDKTDVAVDSYMSAISATAWKH